MIAVDGLVGLFCKNDREEGYEAGTRAWLDGLTPKQVDVYINQRFPYRKTNWRESAFVGGFLRAYRDHQLYG